ncbi:hypothetical protein, partial [Enterobacter hormaechei]|uniref:hypothetical protein n=1 Tax=Enterobacter hormaechei TaxID=158836 RepID=UPI0010558292
VVWRRLFAYAQRYQFRIYGFGLSSPTTINRAYVQSKEHLNNFAVDTQAQAKVKTGDIDHTLLFGVDYSRMRNDINSASTDSACHHRRRSIALT